MRGERAYAGSKRDFERRTHGVCRQKILETKKNKPNGGRAK
jgi:hypothetical protein